MEKNEFFKSEKKQTRIINKFINNINKKIWENNNTFVFTLEKKDNKFIFGSGCYDFETDKIELDTKKNILTPTKKKVVNIEVNDIIMADNEEELKSKFPVFEKKE